MWRLIYAPLSWFVFVMLWIPLILLGWIVVPIAAACEAYKKEFDPNKESKSEDPWVYHFTWRKMFLWDNWEDGIACNTYNPEETSLFKRIVYWSCERNPTNNLRIVPYLSLKINPEKVGFCGSLGSRPANLMKNNSIIKETLGKYDTKIPQWFFAWHGFYTTFFWQFNFRGKLKRFWIGWKIYPTDIYGVTPYRIPGAGFTIQFKTI